MYELFEEEAGLLFSDFEEEMQQESWECQWELRETQEYMRDQIRQGGSLFVEGM